MKKTAPPGQRAARRRALRKGCFTQRIANDTKTARVISSWTISR
jgi:hypothetical protein